MSTPDPPQVFLVRHGTTEWSVSGRHTGVTDIPLTPRGEEDAAAVGRRLAGVSFSAIWTSPRQRARRTCELALAGAGHPDAGHPDAGHLDAAHPDPGHPDPALPSIEVRDDLAEWNYGAYEGLTSEEIAEENPSWSIWTEGGPGGETPAQVTARADGVVADLLAQPGPVAVFSHGHFGRALAVRWLGLDIVWGGAFRLDAGAVSSLGVEHGQRAITTWNQAPGP